MKLQDIAHELDIKIYEDASSIEIAGINTLKDATKNELSFLDNPKYISDLQTTSASAVLVHPKFIDDVPDGCVALSSEEPYMKLALASKLFAPKVIELHSDEPEIGENCTIAPNVYIGKGALIGDGVTLMPGVFIGDNAKVGSDSIIHPNVTIYRDCMVGRKCLIHAGCVVGSDGFGFAHTKTGEHVKIYQNGNVVIEDDVELGGNCAIDRAVFSSTIIRKGVKIDNLVHIAHNCDIGEYSILTGQVGISGSTTMGRNVVMGGQSATAGHLEIAPFTTIAARGGVTKNIKEGGVYAGFPLMGHKQWLKMQGILGRLLKSKIN